METFKRMFLYGNEYQFLQRLYSIESVLRGMKKNTESCIDPPLDRERQGH